MRVTRDLDLRCSLQFRRRLGLYQTTKGLVLKSENSKASLSPLHMKFVTTLLTRVWTTFGLISDHERSIVTSHKK